MSIRSSSGPLIFDMYFSTWRGVHLHSFVFVPQYPHLQGFIEHTSINCAGNVTVPFARETVTCPSSSGCRIISRTFLGNSANSSRNNIPWCARLSSPGRGVVPPPTSAGPLAV